MSTIAKYLPPASDVPSWATDANYTNGPSPATPTKVSPSAGQITEGWLPTGKPPAQWLNWFQNLLQQHVISHSGWHALNWTAGSRIPGTFATGLGVKTPVCSMQSAASGGLPVLCAVSSDGTTRRVYHHSATDVSATDAALDFSLNGGYVVRNVAGGVFSGTATLVALLQSGDFRKSTNLGSTWAAAGSVGISGKNELHYFAAASKWIVAVDVAARLKYSGDLVAWTTGTGVGALPTTPHAIASSASTCLVVYDTAAAVAARSTDGITWTTQTLSGANHDWRGVAYNAVRTAWMAVASDGVGALSIDDGLSWTAVTLPSGAQDVIAVGRHFVAVCTNVHGSVGCSLAVTEDNGATWSEFLLDSDATAQAYDRLLYFDGRLIAVGEDSLQQLQTQFSLRAPWMPMP